MEGTHCAITAGSWILMHKVGQSGFQSSSFQFHFASQRLQILITDAYLPCIDAGFFLPVVSQLRSRNGHRDDLCLERNMFSKSST